MAGHTPRDLPPLREVIDQYDLRTKKSLGQHFLLDLNLTRRIARAAGPFEGVNVFEIGPGPGGLTRALLDEGATVIAIEQDRRCVEALQDLVRAYPGRLTVLEGDALKTDLVDLAPAPRKIVSNLPYNISTVLLLKWLKKIPEYQRLTLMFQREVSDRLLARPHSKDYGRLSVMTQWRCRVEKEFNVDKNAFTPPPKVMSTVVSLFPQTKTGTGDVSWKSMERVVAAAFSTRRKMLRSSLKNLVDQPEPLLGAAKIDPSRRAEDLSVEDFVRLAKCYEDEEG